MSELSEYENCMNVSVIKKKEDKNVSVCLVKYIYNQNHAYFLFLSSAQWNRKKKKNLKT